MARRIVIPPPLECVARLLRNLKVDVVFVGGMIRPLLVSDPAFTGSRPTQDVDLIVNVKSYGAYVQLEDDLRALGFREDREEGAPACRWVVDGIPVDVMPVKPHILGFTNVWYEGAADSALTFTNDACSLRTIDGPHFCATKLEAFASRGDGDMHHHDLEDFIALIDSRPELAEEVAGAEAELRAFVAQQVQDLLSRRDFLEALPGHLAPDTASQARLPLVLSRLRTLAALEPMQLPVTTSFPATAQADGRHYFYRSSNLQWAQYDHPSSVLTIGFQDGSRYDYSSVPEHVYAGLVRAASAGRYFNLWIKHQFQPKKLA